MVSATVNTILKISILIITTLYINFKNVRLPIEYLHNRYTVFPCVETIEDEASNYKEQQVWWFLQYLVRLFKVL